MFSLLLVFKNKNFLYAKTINFYLNCKTSENLISETRIPVEWREDFFTEGTAFSYNHELARFACMLSDASYADVLADATSNPLKKNYELLGINESDMEFHYEINYNDALWGNDQCAFSFASKEIETPAGKRTLILLVIRGTPLNANEWISNLNINDASQKQDEIHKGFATASAVLHTALISYMLRHKIDPTQAYLLITGHSRGGAIANLLSSLLLDDNFFEKGAIYTYTFAAPNVTTNSQEEKYGFIWNIVNAEDVVPTVPMNRGNWKYHKYGNTKVFVNGCNTQKELYDEKFIPKINEYFVKLMGREYAPFKTGPLVPIVITNIVNALSENVEKYYSGAIKLHTRVAKLMNKLFPDKKDTEDAPEQNGGIGSWLVTKLNERTNGGLDYLALAFSDMHANETYLSYMLALSENEIFSTMNYALVTVQGTEEIAIFDENDKLMARVINGKIQYENMTLPVVLIPNFKKNIMIGCPGTINYRAVLSDETLIPTPTAVKVEYFTAAGLFLGEAKITKFYPHLNHAYSFKIGEALVKNFELNKTDLTQKKLSRRESKKIIEQADLVPSHFFNIIPEIYTNTNWTLGFGVHVGTSSIFGSVLTAQELTRFKKTYELSIGFGNQMSIFKQIKFENELFGKFLWTEQEDSDSRKFNFVPEYRTALSLKVLGRITFFTAGMFEFKIKDFNDEAFNSSVKLNSISPFGADKLKVAPSIQFGIRL
ncbi:lipase family protein [Treponema zioleckii]|uniref:lipase family protein n=1 Tax=Treponema zioleckii TaxID=331680 RepID=UPI00168AC513|nr:hypothetical protein [Treponema zioleckii]